MQKVLSVLKSSSDRGGNFTRLDSIKNETWAVNAYRSIDLRQVEFR
jgi:hypothetical protein